MAIPEEEKIPLLRCFHEKSYDRGWKMSCGSGAYKDLMERYPMVTKVFLTLDSEYQRVIADICKKMGNGMADFIPKTVETVDEYDLYCHYVAGLVGVGLSQLFAATGLESQEFFKLPELSNQMGLFLQKTNIIRDYLEDINEEPAPRMFWPKEIWGEYADALAEFKDPENSKAAVQCLNHMVLDALRHAVPAIDYMARLRHPAVFKFCAIPQAMALSTLALCYNNHDVFTRVVKMRRGETAKLMFHLEDFPSLCYAFLAINRRLAAKATQDVSGDDPSQEGVIAACLTLEKHVRAALRERWNAEQAIKKAQEEAPLSIFSRILLLTMSLLYTAYAWQVDIVREWLELPARPGSTGLDRFNRGVAAVFMGYALVMVVTGRRIGAPQM
jgi:farnesyl-diphosphate farnesyltransferase